METAQAGRQINQCTRKCCERFWFECAVHTQKSSNSSTIAAGSSNGVTNTRCCRYSCLRS